MKEIDARFRAAVPDLDGPLQKYASEI